MSNKRLAFYARVSTRGQAEDGFSIDGQLEALRASNYLGHTVVEEYIDRGISGKSMENRPALLKMLDDAKKNKFDELVVWKINRVARSNLDLLKIYETLDSYGVSLRSITESFDTSTPTGKLLFTLLGGIGEFERETIVEHVKQGMWQRSKLGFHNGGKMIGYRSKAIEDSRVKSTLVIVPEEAEIVRFIFELYINGKGYKHIAYKLNELNYKTINGNSFNIQAVKTIITNPTYAGKVRFNRYVNHSKKKRKGTDNEFVLVDGNHESIIDVETWEKAKSIFEKKCKYHKKITKGVFLLTGLLKCPVCGSSLVAGRATRKKSDGTKERRLYYQCSRYKNYGKSECNANSVRADYAEKYVINKLRDFAFDDVLIQEIVTNLNQHVEITVNPIKKRVEQIEQALNTHLNKKDRVFQLYEEGIIDQEILKVRLEKIDIDYNELLETKIQLLNQIDEKVITKEVPVERVKGLLRRFGNLLDMSSRDQTKILLNLVVDKITVTKDREIDQIELRFDQSIQKTLLKEDSSNEESSIFIPFVLVI